MKKIFSISLIFSLLLISCKEKQETAAVTPAKKVKHLTSYVNPFIGTGGHGHTYPGATMPFGMMQLSPDTRLDGWDGCSGYHYSDSYIYGFSHTHLSGTGVSDYADILLMPTNEVNFNNGADGKKGYRAHFSHDNEIAEAGYYKVHLDTTNIDVELTVSKRSGIHKYQFPSAENQVVMLDLEHRDKLLSGKMTKISDTEIVGHRFSEAWASNQQVYYHIQFSKKIKNISYNNTKNPTIAGIELENTENKPVYIKIGISAVDEAGAYKNLEKEIGNKTFDQVKNEAQTAWEKQLEKIVIESDNEDYKTVFYTAMYHTMIAPNIYQDVDGRYRGMDLKVHESKDFDYYTVFSLWDTYRATHPLYTIIEQEKTNDFINTFLAKQDEGGIMPIWDLSACYTGCMIGYHAVPVIADAYLKGIRDYDTEKALKAMMHSATRDKLGLEAYKKYGFIPVQEESESVSKTLEYAYDDWTIAQMAKAMNKNDIYKDYIKRAQNYKNVFDPETKFMRGRIRNTWFTPFDPYEVNFNYTEANSWQYSFYVPQDITGFISLLGGKQGLDEQLDALFSAKTEIAGRHQVDITGLIGQYAHGNEPSHHMAYLYNFINKPHKTQEKIHQILTEQYTNKPDGISGNEDCGQMSAWYVLSSLGFYSVTPASNEYIIGTPLFPKATINLENGKQFTIIANNISKTNKYIKSVSLNGKEHPYSYIKHSIIVNGGELVFNMTDKPSDWATKDAHIPSTSITDEVITPAPFISKGDIAFRDKTDVSLAVAGEKATIFFAVNDEEFKKYEKPFTISEASKLKVYAENNGVKSATVSTQFNKIDPTISIELGAEYASQYSAGNREALIDGLTGGTDYRSGTWQGYHNRDVIATVNLGSKKPIKTVSMNFLEDQSPWIFLPTEVSCYVSNDNKNFKLIKTIKTDKVAPKDKPFIKNVTFNVNSATKYVKIIAKPLGVLPKWHLGNSYDGRSWIFIDEIQIQ